MKKVFFLLYFISFGVFAQVKDVKVELNSGNRYTNQTLIPLTISVLGASECAWSNQDNFEKVTWTPVSTWQTEVKEEDKDKENPKKRRKFTTMWQIDGSKDGEKTVYVRFKDESGKESELYSADIVLDRKAPTDISVQINVSKKANSPNIVDLEFNASEARYMRFSPQKTFYNSFWQAYRNKIEKYDIGTGDGTKYIYAQFRDEAGNESESVWATYELDTQAPIRCKIVAENNKDFSNNPQAIIKLQLSAIDAVQMIISENEKFEGEDWVPYTEKSLDWVLRDKSVGNKRIYAKFRDAFGNESAPVSDDIMFDADAPEDGKIEIEGKTDEKNPDNIVSLKIFAKNADFMIIGNTVNFKNSRWQAYQENIPKWTLGAGFGKKTVYVKFKDKYDNETGIYEANIWIEK